MSKYLLRLLPVMAIFLGTSVYAQNFWTEISTSQLPASEKNFIKPTKSRAFTLDSKSLLSFLGTAPMEFTDAAEKIPLILSLPMPDGGYNRFKIVYSPIMAPALAAKFPGNRTYSGVGIDDPTAAIRFDYTELGFHAMIRSSTGGELFIDPYELGKTSFYLSYDRVSLTAKGRDADQLIIPEGVTNRAQQRTQAGPCIGSTLRKYRLAMSATGEYTTWYGSASAALAGIVTTVNRVNLVYEKDLAVRLELVANNNLIVYTNAATDPFTSANTDGAMLAANHNSITSTIGTANFDVGHVVSRINGGGLAYLGVVCNDTYKGYGATGSTAPIGDAYDIDYVAHELGHQFGGNHTFNAVSSASCTGGVSGTINTPTAVEPGSGITIMAYAGICSPNNLAAHSIPYFHAISQQEITNYLNTTSCAVSTSTGNSIPTANAGNDYIIPKGTPFVLTGSATDGNNSEVLTYDWEEIDAGTGSSTFGNKPFFRSFVPTPFRTRYFPQLSDVVNGTTTIGENLPSNAQTLNFRLTVRDNRSGGGGFCSDDMVVNVDGSTGPFNISSQWSSAELWNADGSAQQLITWDVAGTAGAPVNCANVTILFSADGGQTFPYTLLASTPNNGSAMITVPNIKTTRARVMVKAINNIFFDVNDADFTVTSVCGAVGATVTPASDVTAQAGNSALNLGLSPAYNSFVPAGTITGSSPYAALTFKNTSSSSCAGPYSANQFQYNTYTFSVTVSGSYTFTITSASSGNMLANLYTNSFNSSSACSNFLNSTGTWPGSGGVSLTTNMTSTLTAGATYVLVVGTFDNSAPLPLTYKMSITTGTGGKAYLIGQQFTDPGAGFSYAYVIVKNSTGNIVAISSTSDLTNSTTFSSGQYSVFGLSYSNSVANLNSYVGGSFAALSNQIQSNPTTFCADLSKNAVTVNITGTFPLQFTALKARKQGEKVSLDWGTLTEQNTSHFMVQRSGNGSEFNAEIGNVKAAGNSNSELKYNFIDVNPIKGWNYYRIKQVDVDGRFTYSNIAAVNFEKGLGLMVVYPNPAKDQLNVEYTSERSGKLELQVIDGKGSVLMSSTLLVTSGRNLQTLNISTLSTGMYLLKYIGADGTTSFTKFVKQ